VLLFLRSRQLTAGCMQQSISVVIPVYNSAATLTELVAQLTAELPRLTDRYEIVLVNDGSRDASWAVVTQLAAADPRVRGIDLMRNYGQHNALLCGIRAAAHALIVTIDDDLQHPPAQIAALLPALDAGADVVYGVPQQLQHGLLRNLAARITKLTLQQAMGAEVAGRISALRVFRSRLRDAFADCRSPSVSLDVLLTWATTRFAAVTVRHAPRAVGRSNYTLRMLLRHALTMTTGFSTLPLQLAGLLGLAMVPGGLLLLAAALLGGTGPGPTAWLTAVLVLVSGVQLAALGIIGEYLARMHLRLLDRPAYAVREQTPPPVDR
jgi:glycosyltransferase involved in cell wall biosynthesis